jgi:mRNA interferase RelE/StbE
MRFTVELKPDAIKNLKKIPNPFLKLIKRVILEKLEVNPFFYGKPLKYSLHGIRSIRVGDYRILYKIDEITKHVIIFKIDHRKEVYE